MNCAHDDRAYIEKGNRRAYLATDEVNGHLYPLVASTRRFYKQLLPVKL